MHRIVLGLAILLAMTWTSAGAKSFAEMFPDVKYNSDEAQRLVESLNYQQGQIDVPGAGAKLSVPAGFYFLNAADARRILVDVWGNPPSAADAALGIILPSNKTPIDDTWGAILTYDAEGYISDEDAAQLNYADLLRDMQEGTLAANEERTKAGFPAVKLIGWASPPFYDQKAHKLHWAKELEFGEGTPHTLNYNVRALGRHGVLALNFVANIDQLAEINALIPAVMAIPEFQAGSTYGDFQPGVDKVAAYGIGGLIAGKLAAKAGLFAIALAFLEKGWVLIVLALAAIAQGIRRLQGRKPAPESGSA